MGDYREYQHRNLRGPDGIANSIILTRSYPGNQYLSFLIVEGDSDSVFYRTFIDEDKCQISNAYNKLAAIQVLTILEQEGLPGILVIVDADFDILEGNCPSSRNLLFTDTHDLETMIIGSPALEKVLNAFGSAEKIRQFTLDTGKDMRTLLLEVSLPIGYLRLVSLREGLALTFENIDFSRFIHREKLTFNQQTCLQTVKNKSQRPDITDAQLITGIQQVKNDNHDPWHVCCGHDLVNILSIGLLKAIGTYNTNEVKPDILERSLRLAYEHSHFYKTQLYASIQQWEADNEPFLILAQE